MILLLVSPIVLPIITSSVNSSFLLFLFTVYIFSNRERVKIPALILALLSSFASWPLFILMLIFEFTKSRQKRTVVAKLIILVLMVLLVSNGRESEIVNTYFPILKVETHGFYIDIHRQADLVAGIPQVGRIFYNKYIVVLRAVFEEFAKYFDWDYLVFQSASGKFASDTLTFALITIFELPFLIYGLYLGIKKKIKGLVYLPMAGLSMALYKNDNALLLVFLMLTCYVFLQAWKRVRKILPKSIFFIYTALIIFGRGVLVYHSQSEFKARGSTYEVHEELVGFLKTHKVNSPIFLTDRLGQAHIYLTYFGVNSLSELKDNLAVTLRRDSKGILQIDKQGNFVFTSFVYKPNLEIVQNNPQATFIELTSNFPEEIKTSEKFNTNQLEQKIVGKKNTKDIETNLFILTK
jgi:hypothetical protein